MSDKLLMPELKLNESILVNYCVMETRALSPSANFDGLIPREITIQFIHDLLMTG